MTRSELTDRLMREWIGPLEKPGAINAAGSYVLEVDASDPCCPRLSLNGVHIATSPGAASLVTVGEFAVTLAALLPGLTNQHDKRIRRVRIEVA